MAVGYSEPEVKFTSNPINPNTVGVLGAGTFKATATALARYTVTEGAFKGLYLGGSFQYRGPWRESTAFGGIIMPAYSVINPFIGYDWTTRTRWNTGIRLDVRNVFDTPYATRNIVGEPFGIFLSGNIRFR